MDAFIREGELRRMVGDEVLQLDFMHMSAITNRDKKKEPLIILMKSGSCRFLEIRRGQRVVSKTSNLSGNLIGLSCIYFGIFYP